MTRFDAEELELDAGATLPGWAQGGSVHLAGGAKARIVNSYRGRVGGFCTLILTRADDPTADQRAENVRAAHSEVVARLTLGWPGVSESVDLDWLHGTMVVLPTPNVAVDAIGVDRDGAEWRAKLGAYVVPGVPPAGVAFPLARRTIYVDELAASDDSGLLTIPARATSVSLLVDEPIGGYGSVALDFCGPNNAAAIVASTPLYRAVPGDDSPHLLAEAVRTIRVVNLSGTTAIRPVLVFGLAL